jgi:guanosine-3',5'-bis(diphosphate) 3'-pyrophosphohydrolase
MTSDLAKLMEKISLLQSEPTPEPIIEIEKPTMHPLVQAMQELRDEELREYNIRKTKKFIQRAHDQEQGQMYGDMPYSSHPKQVANLGKKFFGPKFNDEAVKVALLHDVLEDTPYTPEQLAKKGFSKEVIEAVQLLTKNKALSYADNIRNIINSGNPLAMMVKYSDNYMNYSGDKSHWDADRAAHSQKKYLASLNMLGDVLGIKKHVGEEPVDEEIAYHGTTDDIAEFHPLSHFGTEKAAKDRMTYKKIKDGKIYKVDLDIKNPLTIKDFPGIHYDRLYAFELRDKKLISQKEMEAITTIDDKAELRKALLTKLKELGIDGFVYKNRYEDKGNISYVIVDPSQVKVLSVEPAAEEVTEASPNTLEGSFTPDLVESKTWLAEMLAKGLKGKNAGTIYVLGSWYGNMGIFLQQAGVQFDKLVLVEPDEEALMRSKDLLQKIGDEGKLILIHQKAEDVVYEKPGVVINTSCNETGPVFLTKLPDNMLCLLQARNNNENTLFPTEDEEDFIDYFPLEKVYYTGEKHLEDPEVNYVRYMKIGRTGKKIDEELHTGGALGLPFPGTYEQEYDKFKSTGQRRITSMTNEALDSSYPYRNSKRNPGNDFYFDTEDGQEYKVEFSSIWGNDAIVGFAARGQGDEHKIGLTGTGNSRKIFGTVIKIVKDYIRKANPESISFSANNSEPSRIRLYKMLASQADKELPNYKFADAFSDGGFTTFYLTQNDAKVPASTKVKAKAGKALDAVFEVNS